MTESREARASHEEVQGFVARLKEFHGSLGESERAMLETILEGAQQGDTGGYAIRIKRYGTPEEGGSSESQVEGWNDLIGWIEEQGEEDTQGFGLRWGG